MNWISYHGAAVTGKATSVEFLPVQWLKGVTIHCKAIWQPPTHITLVTLDKKETWCDLQPNPMRLYPEVSRIMLKGAYSQISEDCSHHHLKPFPAPASSTTTCRLQGSTKISKHYQKEVEGGENTQWLHFYIKLIAQRISEYYRKINQLEMFVSNGFCGANKSHK